MANVAKEKRFKRLREALEKRREEIFRLQGRLDESWKELREREVEFEENAAKTGMSLGLDKLDELEKREIEAIDMALHRMDTGEYGICQFCGKAISPERLEAIPWTPICTRCAAEPEEEPGAAATQWTGKAEVPPDREGMRDDELETAVHEELRKDGRVELEELQISVRGGVLHIEGALPSETSHEILLEILQDTMGLHEIEDNLRTEELLWERKDREAPTEVKKTEDEELLQGEDINEDVFDSLKSGEPVSPPDEFVPQKEEP